MFKLFKLVIKDKIFRLGAYLVRGRIVAQNGLFFFASLDNKVITSIPWYIKAEDIDREIVVYVRPVVNEIVTRMTRDDVAMGSLKPNEIEVISNLKLLMSIAETIKVKRAQYILKAFYCLVFSVAGALICMALDLYNLMIAGWWLALVFGIVFFSLGNALKTNRIYDKRGRYVDLTTGQTNLGDNYMIDLGKCRR